MGSQAIACVTCREPRVLCRASQMFNVFILFKFSISRYSQGCPLGIPLAALWVELWPLYNWSSGLALGGALAAAQVVLKPLSGWSSVPGASARTKKSRPKFINARLLSAMQQRFPDSRWGRRNLGDFSGAGALAVVLCCVVLCCVVLRCVVLCCAVLC